MKRNLGRELLMMTLPLAAIGLVALFFWWRNVNAPRLLSTPTPISTVFYLSNNRIFAIGSEASATNPLAPPQIYQWDAKSGQPLMNRVHSVSTAYSSVSPDGKLWAYKIRTATPLTFAGTEIRNTSDLSLVMRTPLLLETQRWEGQRDLGHYNLTTQKYEIWRLDEATGTIKRVHIADERMGETQISPDGAWRARSETKTPQEFDVNRLEVSNVFNKRFFAQSTHFEPLKSKQRARTSQSYWNSARWTSDSRAFVGLITLEPYPVQRTDAVRFDAKTGVFSSVQVQTVDKSAPYGNFSPDGKTLIGSNSGGQLWHIWDALSGKHLRSVGATVKNPVARSNPQAQFSPDSRFWLRPTERGVEIWDLSSLDK